MEQKKPQNIRIIKDEVNPETPELLADSIVRIGKGFGKLINQGLTEEAIVVLLKGMSGMAQVSIVDIRLVLRNLPKLSSYYVKR